MLKNILKLVAIFIIGIVGGIFADQILWPYFVEKPLFLKYHLKEVPLNVTEVKQVFIQENTALENAVEKVSKSVVGIGLESKTKKLEGLGLIVTSDGLIITFSSVVPKGTKPVVYFENKMIPSKVIQIKDGLALLKIDKENLPTLAFADSGRVKLGKRVFAVGNIYDEGKIKTVVNEGIVRYTNDQGIHTNIFDKETMIGSALFDIKGDVLGLNMVDNQGNLVTIPISKIRDFLGF